MKKKFLNKKVIGIGLAAGLLLGAGGAAFAYFLGSGSGTGQATTANSAPINITDNSGSLAALGPGVSAQNVTLYLDNTASASQYVTSVTVTLTTSNEGACPASNYEINGTQYGSPVTLPYGGEIAPGSTTWSNAYNIAFYDVNSNQSACEGLQVGLSYTIP